MGVIIAGVVMLILGFWGMFAYWWSFVEAIRGIGPLLLILFGLIVIGAQIRNASRQSEKEA
ncbi:MAG: hypothetical protein LHV68_05995 [Elusimicrobia bacterium]|nr:hypothetical protein [Candidatus Liberimonas magnetica]